MTATEQSQLARRLRYIIHCGLVEIRNLASVDGTSQRIHDLADALEILPRYLEEATDEDVEIIRSVLVDYQARYPNSRDILKYLDWHDVPDRY